MHIHIVYYAFFTKDGSRRAIGGVETYIGYLATVLTRAGYQCSIYQWAHGDFTTSWEGCTVHGVDTQKYSTHKGKWSTVFHNLRPRVANDDLVIIANDSIPVDEVDAKIILIQHGIGFDIVHHSRILTPLLKMKKRLPTPTKEAFGSLIDTVDQYGRFFQSANTLRKLEAADTVVCVDYNFVNWYRTQTNRRRVRFTTIPNCVDTSERVRRVTPPSNTLRLIFARRFVQIRGTRIFADALDNLLSRNLPVSLQVTIAGSGPDESYLRRRFAEFSSVEFLEFLPEQSLSVHSRHDIAVVPSIGSEGTSFSLLEAMASGCAVVATDVGGMTNILLDGFNGIIVSPEVDQLAQAILTLILDNDLRARLAANAQMTVDQAFSYEKWASEWLNVVNSFEDRAQTSR